jgi:hypothetical protein
MILIRFSGVEFSSKGAPNLIESFMILYFIKFLGQNVTAENLYLGCVLDYPYSSCVGKLAACHDTVNGTAPVTDISRLHSV